MNEFIKEFINIWNEYSNVLSVQPPEFDMFLNVINKLRKEIKLDIKEKKIFICLVELMADTIYARNNCADKYEIKYGTTNFDKSETYDEPELNCCSNLLNNLDLESEIY